MAFGQAQMRRFRCRIVRPRNGDRLDFAPGVGLYFSTVMRRLTRGLDRR